MYAVCGGEGHQSQDIIVKQVHIHVWGHVYAGGRFFVCETNLCGWAWTTR
jgi:hypothetical protein